VLRCPGSMWTTERSLDILVVVSAVCFRKRHISGAGSGAARPGNLLMSGQPPPTFSGLWTGSAWQNAYSGDINGTALWPMRWGHVAPRVALAYHLPVGLVLRAGSGTFRGTASLRSFAASH
jgi:hypothetical protein